MTVAIAFERYVAVHNPINYNRAMNDAKATRTRVLKFLVPVLLLAVIVSVPKFFEARLDERIDPLTNDTIFFVNYTKYR